ncbi:uncharacterized protein N7498_001144 [Penicillium cinerascens]|uniref:Uncharacterized protein n=1 Tax=Penicillium cinerascens TaxID=70096 RepID=A0A9W9NFK4_9EURO|nr:uncharacterized protein N7498_001144 [Penicillium cinerascens]KAJ5219045.1 hypothetical protein N7498_001144 [Penicillium cinerascens]
MSKPVLFGGMKPVAFLCVQLEAARSSATPTHSGAMANAENSVWSRRPTETASAVMTTAPTPSGTVLAKSTVDTILGVSARVQTLS